MVSGGAENYSFRLTYMNENLNCIYTKNHSLYCCTASRSCSNWMTLIVMRLLHGTTESYDNITLCDQHSVLIWLFNEYFQLHCPTQRGILERLWTMTLKAYQNKLSWPNLLHQYLPSVSGARDKFQILWQYELHRCLAVLISDASAIRPSDSSVKIRRNWTAWTANT